MFKETNDRLAEIIQDPNYKGWIQSSGNTAVTWRMCVGWHYCRLYLIAEVQLK